MKKLRHILFFALFPFAVNAQLSQTFDGVALNAQGRGTIPSPWKQVNVDGKTPNSNLSYFGTNAWIVLSNGVDTFAASHSWYTPAGASNDWLISPSVTVPTGTPYLTFNAMAPDASYPDGFVLKVSTTNDSIQNFTTDLLTVNAANQTFTDYAVNISNYAGQTVYFAWVNQSNDMFLLYLDDINVMNLPAMDVAVVDVSLPRLTQTNFNNPIEATIKNLGSTPITSITLAWNDGGTPNSQTLTGLNIPALGEYTHTFSSQFNKSTVDEFSVTVELSNPNGQADPITSNNSQVGKISTIGSNPFKRVLIEEGTGTWCQWCPRGHVAMEHMVSTHPSDFVGIAVHNGDPMTVAAYDAAANFGGYPSANVDRTLLDQNVGVNEFEDYYSQRKTALTPAVVGGVYSINGSTVTIQASATFSTKMSTDIRLAAIILEDSVTGTTAGYNQQNSYAGGANGPMGGFESLPNPVPAAQMVYNHVGRALLGGYNGQQGSVTLPALNGSTAVHTYTYTVPAAQDVNQIKIAVLLIDNVTGEVYNSYYMNPSVDVANIEKPEINMAIFPNPVATNQDVNVSFSLENKENVSLEVYNIQGKKVYAKDYSDLSGEQKITFNTNNFASGSYLVSVTFGKYSFVKNIQVVK